MSKKLFWLSIVLISAGSLGQDIQVNRQNKTIAVTAEESVTADAEIAVLDIGYHNFASSQDAAFRENLRVAERITQALLQAKIPAENIETEKLRLGLAQVVSEKWTEEMKKEKAFEAQQSWHVRVSAPHAQAVVDVAVNAGANEVNDVEWNVTDPVSLQDKATGVALAKARSVADQMAKGLGAKLGELVYASNRAPIARAWGGAGGAMETVEVQASVSGVERQPKLKLFPEKVKMEATVYAVFAIE